MRRPSTIEVIEAIFTVFSEEELKSMQREKDGLGRPDPGIKQIMISLAKNIKPRYPIDKSVEKAKEIVEPLREELPSARARLFKMLLLGLFYC